MTTSRVFVLAAAIAAPLLFVAGQALLPPLGRELDTAFPLMIEHRDQLIVSRLLTVAGSFLMLPALWLISRLGGRVARIGAAVAGVGTFFNAVSNSVQGYTAWAATAPGLDHEATMQTLVQYERSLVGLPIGYWSIPVFGLGLLTLGVGLLVARRVAWWMPALLLIGVVAAFLTAGLGPIVALTEAPLAIAMVALAVRSASPLAERPATVHAVV